MRAQVSEVVLLTQLARKIYLTFRLLVPHSIAGILVIKISICVLVPTLMIIFTLFFIPSGLLVALMVERLHGNYTRRLGGLRQSRGLSRSGLINRQLTHLFHNRIRRFSTCTTHNVIHVVQA